MNTSNKTIFELSADQFAALNQVKAQSVRARLCRTGSYFGIHPMKLANGRLVWPAIYITYWKATPPESPEANIDKHRSAKIIYCMDLQYMAVF